MRYVVAFGFGLVVLLVFLFVPVRHEIDRVEIEVRGAKSSDEMWPHIGWKTSDGSVARSKQIDEGDLAVFENVPAGKNFAYVFTDRCPGTEKHPNVLVSEFTITETSRFVRVELVRVEFDINTCKYSITLRYASGFVW